MTPNEKEDKNYNPRLFRIEEDYDELDYALQNLKQAESLGNKEFEGKQLFQVGSLYKDRKNYQEALRYLKKADKIFEQIKNLEWKAATLNSIAQIYFKQVKNEKAINYLEKAIKILEEIGLGDSPQALEMKTVYKMIKDILNQSDKNQ